MLQVVFVVFCLTFVGLTLFSKRFKSWIFPKMDRVEEYCKRAGWAHGYFVGLTMTSFLLEQYILFGICVVILLLMHFGFRVEEKEEQRKEEQRKEEEAQE